MNNGTLTAETRESSSRGDLNKLRQEGKVPGIIYGKDVQEPTPITVDGKQLQAVLRSNAHSVLEMDVKGMGKQPVLLTEVQRDPISREVLHIDFHKINMNETVRVPVRLEFTGESAGAKEGGMLQLVLHELEVECLPKDLPEFISVDVGPMDIGDHLNVGDLKLPEGVKPMLDSDAVVAAVLAPTKAEADDEAEPAEGAADTPSPAKTSAE